jgi:serine palmitoyltransferase
VPPPHPFSAATPPSSSFVVLSTQPPVVVGVVNQSASAAVLQDTRKHSHSHSCTSYAPTNSFHVVIEFAGIFVILFLIFHNKSKPTLEKPLSKREEDELIASWQPEPLGNYKPVVRQLTPASPRSRIDQMATWLSPSTPKSSSSSSSSSKSPGTGLHERRIVSSVTGPRVNVNGRDCVNFMSYNFLGLAGDTDVLEACKATIRKFGVGACGPRGFYGTLDAHRDLEARIAKFMGTDDALIYSDGCSTLMSVIPAFSKRGDLIVCDDGVHALIQVRF